MLEKAFSLRLWGYSLWWGFISAVILTMVTGIPTNITLFAIPAIYVLGVISPNADF